MFRDDTSYAPLDLYEYEHAPGKYCLMLSDNQMVDLMSVFDEHGRYGNGYGWADVALQAMRVYAPEIEEKVELDPEAGTFAASSTDLAALKKLATLLHQAFHDHAKLGELVEEAPFEFD